MFRNSVGTVLAESVERNLASLTAASQYAGGSLLCESAARAEFISVRFMRSAMDFSSGVYGVVGRNVMPRCAR